MARQLSSTAKKTGGAAVRARRAEAREQADFAHIRAEDSGLTPLFPQNLITPALYGRDWLGDINFFEKARKLWEGDDFIGGVHAIKLDYFNDGFRVVGAPAAKGWIKTNELALHRLARDVWTEFLMQDNAIAFWVRPAVGQIPAVCILDCEICSYTNHLGHETLTVKPKRNPKITPDQIRALGQRWGEAYSKGTAVVVDSSKGEFFKVLTRQKLGNGLGTPRLKQIITQVSSYDLLQLADWSGAFLSKTLIRHFKKGHEIKQGEQAGKSTHFVTLKQAKKLAEAVRNKTGAFDLISNFDLDIVYSFLQAAFFDPKKYAGIIEQMELWAGPAALMRKSGNVSTDLMDMFRAEGMANRKMVGMFIESILNDRNYIEGDAGGGTPGELKVRFNPRSFLNTKLMLEWVRLGVPNGLIAPQTGTDALGADTAEETALLKEAHKDVQAYTPVFEAKQGMVGGDGGSEGGGGRPSTVPTAETPAPGAGAA